MTLKSPVKKTVLSLAMIVPLALSACGSGDDAAEDSTGSSAAASSGKAGATSSSAAPSSEQASSSEQAPAGADSEDAQALANGETPLGNVPVVKPVEGGQAASQADVDAINGLVRGLYETTTLRQFFQYMPDHACQAVRNANNGELANMDYNQVPDVPMDSLKSGMAAEGQDTSGLEGFDWNATGVDSVNDVLVNGDDASATINVNTNNGVDSSTMRFKREGGNWTFCGEY